MLGITPQGFNGTVQGVNVEISVPLSESEHYVSAFGRLKQNVGRRQAEAALDALFQHLTRDRKFREFNRAGSRVILEPGEHGHTYLRTPYEQPLLVLMLMVGLVLLAACANVSNLVMARISSRKRELAIRIALGATRKRLMRQFLTENLLLAGPSAVLSMGLAYWADRALIGLAPHGNGGGELVVDVHPDWRVLLFTTAITILASILCAVGPALRGTSPELTSAPKSEWNTGLRYRLSLTNALVVLQVALSLVLLIGAGLFVRSLLNLRAIDPGFDPQNLVLLTVDAPDWAGYSLANLQQFTTSVIERIRGIPDVISASPALISPLSGDFAVTGITVPGYQPQPNEDMIIAVNWVGADYFGTLRAPIVTGRMFTDRDAATRRIAVVNETLAKHFWSNENPLGKHVLLGGRDRDDYEIIGVVRDLKSESLGQDSQPAAYVPFRYTRSPHITLHVRVAHKTSRALSEIIQELHAVDPRIAAYKVTTMADQINRTIGRDRLLATVTGLLGLLGLVLVSTGLYGVMAFSIALRTRDIGLRLALGAEPRTVLSEIVLQAALLTSVGIAFGLGAALYTSRLLHSLLYGLSPVDAPTYLLVSVLLTAVTVSAAWMAARHAASLDPMAALRYE